MSATAIGTSVKRKEDASLLRGRGTYVENLTLPGTVFMAVVRHHLDPDWSLSAYALQIQGARHPY